MRLLKTDLKTLKKKHYQIAQDERSGEPMTVKTDSKYYIA